MDADPGWKTPPAASRLHGNRLSWLEEEVTAWTAGVLPIAVYPLTTFIGRAWVQYRERQACSGHRRGEEQFW